MGTSSNTWFISDTHFSHQKIIEYTNRPFPNADIMDINMIHWWNEIVRKNDIVYHLGDFGLTNKEQTTAIVSQLNGKIKLVKGNHDVHNNQWYRDCGFVEVYDHPIIIKDFLVLSHEPMPFILNSMYVNVFGHVHTSPMYETWGPHYACVCVERHDYCPISLETIKKHFTEEGIY